jgi:hypothetical protein
VTASAALGALSVARRGGRTHRFPSSESESKSMGGREVGYAADASEGRRAVMTGRGGDAAEGMNL